MEKELNHYLINDLVNIVCDYHYANFKDCYDRLIREFSDIISNTRNQIEPWKQYTFSTVRTYSFGSKIWGIKTLYLCVKCDSCKFVFKNPALICCKNHKMTENNELDLI